MLDILLDSGCLRLLHDGSRLRSQVLSSLTALSCLTRLVLHGHMDVGPQQEQQVVEGLGKLRTLASLQVRHLMPWDAYLAPLSALQALTSIELLPESLDQGAALLAGLGQLQEVKCNFEDVPAAAVALAGSSSFSGFISSRDGAPAAAPPRLDVAALLLPAFQLAAVECLQLAGVHKDVDAVRQALPRCTNLKAMQMKACPRLAAARLVQAIAACKQLQHLHLQFELPDEHLLVLLVLQGVKQLTLSGAGSLSIGTIAALMLLPRLRLLRLLGCDPGFSQAQAQVLVGQLQVYELQVDVVPGDDSVRAGWEVRKLEGRWREVVRGLCARGGLG